MDEDFQSMSEYEDDTEDIEKDIKDGGKGWPYRSPGIPDVRFIQGGIPMTGAEVRALTISKLRLKKEHTVCDVGAGTGSVSVEAALMAYQGRVWALEKEQEGRDLIDKNAQKFACNNIEIIEGRAPESMRDIPPCDRIFIGGSGGRLAEIISAACNILKPSGRLVINAVTLNTLTTARQELAEKNCELEIVSLQCARTRKLGDYDLLSGLNPVFVIAADGCFS